MKWFFRWILNNLRTLDKDERENDSGKYEESPLVPRRRGSNLKIGLAIPGGGQKVRQSDSDDKIHLHTNPLIFKIYPATGGHIVEYSYYNERKDSNDQALHLIPSELDLGAELAKIMTLEALKR